MTIRAAPAASGVNTLWLSTLITTTNVRKNAPIVSTVYLRISVAHMGTGIATDSGWLVMTSSAICFPSLSTKWCTQRLRVCGPAVILANGYLSPRLTELAEFLLTVTMLATSLSAHTDMEIFLCTRRWRYGDGDGVREEERKLYRAV